MAITLTSCASTNVASNINSDLNSDINLVEKNTEWNIENEPITLNFHIYNLVSFQVDAVLQLQHIFNRKSDKVKVEAKLGDSTAIIADIA